MTMGVRRLKCAFLLLFLLPWCGMQGQKLITYEAGMGTRDRTDPDVWVLYRGVTAWHEGMTLRADSALLNTVRNDLMAFGNVSVEVSDTTVIFGDQLYYDGVARTADIWDDTVRMVDGRTLLRSDHLTYDRNTSVAAYDSWGITTNEGRSLSSRVGFYNSDLKIFDIYGGVVLSDTSMRLETDTLNYDVEAEMAYFWSPTWLYTDSATVHSRRGTYDAGLRKARSVKSSEVHSGGRHLYCDTLDYDEPREFGRARGNVCIIDSVNGVVSTGRYAETDQQRRLSLVTDSVLVRFAQRGEGDTAESDTLYLHADTVFLANDTSRAIEWVAAYRHVKLFRSDAQAMGDSMYYSAADSSLRLFYDPVIWYNDYQATADTVVVLHDTAGARQAFFSGGSFFVEQLDWEKYNQIKGRNTVVYFRDGSPHYADIAGNAELTYHILEEDAAGNRRLIGVNAGVGSDMRIYFKDNAPDRVVTMGSPDMHAYPLEKLPAEKARLGGFRWYEEERPKCPEDVFRW